MIIKSVYLKNIRSYTEQQINFNKGVSLLAGDIGAGKSTILLAIDFALFGLQRGELSGGALLRNGAEYGIVTLEFNIGENNYKIQRVLKKSGGKEDSGIVQDAGFLSINGDIVKGTAIELKQRIIDILNYPAESLSKKSLVYRYTVYTPQEEMKAILIGDAESRLETLRKLFNIDKYKRISDNSCVIAGKLREKKKELAAKIYDLNDKKNKLDDLNIKFLNLQPELLNAEETFKNLYSEVENKKKNIFILEDKIKRLIECKKNKEVYNSELKSKNELLNRLNDELIILKKEIELSSNFLSEDLNVLIEMSKGFEIGVKNKEENLINSRKRIVENSTNKKNHEQFLDRLKKESDVLSIELTNIGEFIIEDLNLITEKIKILESNLKIKEEELQSSRKIIIENETKKKHQEHLNNQILSLDNCPTCKQNVSVEHKISIQKESLGSISKLDENISKASEFEKEINEKVKLIKEEIEILKGKIKDIEIKKSQKIEIEKKKFKHESLLNEIIVNEKKLHELLEFKIEFDESAVLKEIESLRGQLKDIEIKKSQRQEIENKKKKTEVITNEIKNSSDRLQELEELKFKLDNEIQELIYVEQDYITIKDEFENFRKLLQDSELKVLSFKKDIEFVNKEIIGLSDEIKFKEGIRAKVDEFNRIYEFLDVEFLKMVEMMERKVMLRVHSEFNSLFSRWLGVLLNNEVTSAVLDSEFTPVIRQNGYDIDYLNLSGGEKTACALAYRLALNHVVNSIDSSINTKDLIILDEPTDGFSPEQLEILKDVLSQLKMEQIILVSHEPKIESFASHIIRVEKNESHISRISYI